MHRILLPLLLIVLLFACQERKLKQQISFSTSVQFTPGPKKEAFDLDKHLKNYESLRKRILVRKKELRTMNPESRKIAFFHTLVDSIFPYWYGTEWDFNGITESPRKGEIACGYFVSTTLKHMGIRLNRYKNLTKSYSASSSQAFYLGNISENLSLLSKFVK